MTFGERMRAKRKALGLTLVELGEKVGCSHSALSLLETGKSQGGEVAAKVKRILGLRGSSPTKAPRKPKAAIPGLERVDTVVVILATLESLRKAVAGLTAAVEANTAAIAPRIEMVHVGGQEALQVDLSLVPSVAEQRAMNADLTAKIAEGGIKYRTKMPGLSGYAG